MQDQTQYNQPQDEIDLAELFANLWKKRLAVALVMLIGVLIGGSVFLSHWLTQPLQQSAVIELRFNFAGVSKGQYPNGQAFSANDLVSSSVLTQAYTQNKLADFGLARQDFMESIEISPFATNRAFIEEKFKSALNQKGLSSAEIDELNSNYMAALDAASRGFAQLSLSVAADLAIPNKVLLDTLTSIPSIWAKTSIHSYGVLNIAVAKPEPLADAFINEAEYIVAAQYLLSQLDSISQSTKTLEEDDLALLQIDPQTGWTILDIVNQIDNLKTFHLDILLGTFATTPIVKDPQSAITYLNNQLTLTQDQALLAQSNAHIAQDTYNRYMATGRNPAIPNTSSNNSNTGSSYNLPENEGFLNKIMALGDSLSDQEFRQTLLMTTVETRKQAEQAQAKLNRLQANKLAFEKKARFDSASQQSISAKIQFIKQQINLLAAATVRIIDLRSQHVLGQTGALYDLNSEARITSNFMGQIKALIKFTGLGGIAGLFIGLFVALILAVTRKSQPKSQTQDTTRQIDSLEIPSVGRPNKTGVR